MSNLNSFLTGVMSHGHLDERLNNWYDWNEQAKRNALNKIAENTGIIADQLYISNAIGKARLSQELDRDREADTERYYKSLTFKNGELLEILNEIPDPVLKYHFYDSLYADASDSLWIAMEELDELEDKQAAKDIKRGLYELGKELEPHRPAFEASLFPPLHPLVLQYEALEKSIPQKPCFISADVNHSLPKAYITGVLMGVLWLGTLSLSVYVADEMHAKDWVNPFIWSFVFGPALLPGVLLYRELRKISSSKRFLADRERFVTRDLPEYESRVKNIREQLDAHALFRHMDKIKQQFPDYTRYLDAIKKIEQRFNNKWATKKTN